MQVINEAFIPQDLYLTSMILRQTLLQPWSFSTSTMGSQNYSNRPNRSCWVLVYRCPLPRGTTTAGRESACSRHATVPEVNINTYKLIYIARAMRVHALALWIYLKLTEVSGPPTYSPYISRYSKGAKLKHCMRVKQRWSK